MNTNNSNIPLYLKLAQIIMGVVGLFFIFYIGRSILVPIIFATILAILLNPLVNYLVRKKVNRIFAISVALIIAIIIVASLFYFIVSQLAKFSGSLPQFEQSFQKVATEILQWV